MKTTSRLLGCIAIASSMAVAPSAFAKGGGVTTATVRPTTTAVFQPAQDPLGPKPAPSTGLGASGAPNGHIFRVIPPPAGHSGGEVTTFNQRPVIFTARPITSVNNAQSSAGGTIRSSAGVVHPQAIDATLAQPATP